MAAPNAVAQAEQELQDLEVLCERDRRIKQLVDHHYSNGKLIPLRRRGFESDAMLREILRLPPEARAAR